MKMRNNKKKYINYKGTKKNSKLKMTILLLITITIRLLIKERAIMRTSEVVIKIIMT